MIKSNIADIFGKHELNYQGGKPQSSSKSDDSVELLYTKQLRSQSVKVADGSLCEFTGTHWHTEKLEDSEFKASAWLESIDPAKFSADRIAGMVKAAIKRLPRLDEATPDVIPTLGGYLTVKKNAQDRHEVHLGKHDPDCNIRYCINAELPSDEEWDKAESSLFFKFINVALPDGEVQDMVQDYIGYTLLGDTRFQTAILFLGTGANGKGTLMKIVKALHHRVAAADLAALDNFGMQQLIGASLVLIDELPVGNLRGNEQKAKSLISGDSININRKYRDPIEFTNTAKFIISGNHIPKGLDRSFGMWRRLKVVNFNTTIPEDQRDGLLHEKIIANELGIVLKWALDGLIRLLDRGHFTEPQAVKNQIRMAQVQSSSVLQHIEDIGAVVHTPDKFTHKDQIYRAYRDWCINNGKSPEASDGFWKQVIHECKQQLGLDLETKQKWINGQKLRVVDIAIEPHPLDDDATVKKYSAKELFENGIAVEVGKDDDPFKD